MNIICIANQKGGVGKTTTAINMSAALAILGKKTLVVDCDPQGNATSGLGLDKSEMEQTLYHGLMGETTASHLIFDTEIEQLKIIPSRLELAEFETQITQNPDREKILSHFLADLNESFEYIILDSPPSLGLLGINAMTAAQSLLIPLQCEFYALEGLGQLLQTMTRIRRTLNPTLSIAGILLTMYDQRTNLARRIVEDAKKHSLVKELLFNSVIPRNVKLGEAPSVGKPILLYDSKSVGAKSYTAVAKELIRRHADK